MQNNKIIKLYKASSYLLMLGVIHAALTPLFYDFLSPNGMWFFGAGLALVFLSLLNIAASQLLNMWLLKLAFIANIIGTIYALLIVFVLQQPQAYIGLLFHLIVLTSSIFVIRYLMTVKTANAYKL